MSTTNPQGVLSSLLAEDRSWTVEEMVWSRGIGLNDLVPYSWTHGVGPALLEQAADSSAEFVVAWKSWWHAAKTFTYRRSSSCACHMCVSRWTDSPS